MTRLDVYFTGEVGDGLCRVGVYREGDEIDEMPLPLECDEDTAEELRSALLGIEPAPEQRTLRERLKSVLNRFGITYEI